MSSSQSCMQPNLQLQASHAPMSDDEVAQIAQDKPPKSAKLMKAFALIKQFATLGTVLRSLGVTSITAGLLVFLANGYQNTEHAERFWWLMSLTAIMQIIGLALAKYSKDRKGARTLLALSLLAVPTLSLIHI